MDHSGSSEFPFAEADITSSQEVTLLDDSFIGLLRRPPVVASPPDAKLPPRKRALGESPDMSPMFVSGARRPTVLKVRFLSERARGVRISSAQSPTKKEGDGDVEEPRPPVDHQPFLRTDVEEGPGAASADPKEKRDEITPAKCSTKVPFENSPPATEPMPAFVADHVENEDDDFELPMTLLEAIKLLTPEPGLRIAKMDFLDILETKGVNLNPPPTDPQPFLGIVAKGEQAAEKRDGSVSCIAQVPYEEKELPAEPLPSSKLLPRVTGKTQVPCEDEEEPPMTLLEAIKLLTPEPRPKNTDMNILDILKMKGIDFGGDDGR